MHFKARAPKRDLSCVSIVTTANIKHDKNFYFSLKLPHFAIILRNKARVSEVLDCSFFALGSAPNHKALYILR